MTDNVGNALDHFLTTMCKSIDEIEMKKFCDFLLQLNSAFFLNVLILIKQWVVKISQTFFVVLLGHVQIVK